MGTLTYLSNRHWQTKEHWRLSSTTSSKTSEKVTICTGHTRDHLLFRWTTSIWLQSILLRPWERSLKKANYGLRVTLQQKILQRCSVVATSVDAQTYPRTVGPLTALLVDPPTSELVASIGGELLTSFLKYYNFKREVIDAASNNCVVCITILFNDMQKVNGMQLNIVRIFSEIMKHMLSIKKNVFIDL